MTISSVEYTIRPAFIEINSVGTGHFVEQALGAPKNNQVFFVNNRGRIPDFVLESHLVEVKNVDRLRDTSQLRDFTRLAAEKGKPLVIVTRQSTKISKKVFDSLTRRGALIVGCLPGA